MSAAEGESTMTTLAEFIARHGITADVRAGVLTWAHRLDDGLRYPMAGWTVTLTSDQGVTMIVPFFTGSAITSVETDDVLNCLALDAAGVENAGGSFEAWADEYGLDSNSRATERTYRATVEQTDRLRAWLGDDTFAELVWETESL